MTAKNYESESAHVDLFSLRVEKLILLKKHIGPFKVVVHFMKENKIKTMKLKYLFN